MGDRPEPEPERERVLAAGDEAPLSVGDDAEAADIMENWLCD